MIAIIVTAAFFVGGSLALYAAWFNNQPKKYLNQDPDVDYGFNRPL